jgi:hypothetical protein
MEIDDQLKQKIDNFNRKARAKWGDEGFEDVIEHLGKSGVTADAMAEYLRVNDDAVDDVNTAGKNAMLNLMGSEDRAVARKAEEAYRRIREQERAAYKKSRGR